MVIGNKNKEETKNEESHFFPVGGSNDCGDGNC